MFASSTETAGSGRYADEQWEVSTKGRATDAQARIVTLREIMHAELNDSTAWGSLFHAYATGVYRPDRGCGPPASPSRPGRVLARGG